MADLIGRKMFDETFHLLQRSLGLRVFRQKVLASNIANKETPNFVPQDVPFERVLSRSLKKQEEEGVLRKTHPHHLSAVPSVDTRLERMAEEFLIDREMAKLAENNLRFHADVQALVKRFENLRLAITEGR